jgi:hypothetical protein
VLRDKRRMKKKSKQADEEHEATNEPIVESDPHKAFARVDDKFHGTWVSLQRFASTADQNADGIP